MWVSQITPPDHGSERNNNTSALVHPSTYCNDGTSCRLSYSACSPCSCACAVWQKRRKSHLAGTCASDCQAICGYATITDWTASAPISRHSGYRHHDSGIVQSWKKDMFIASLILKDVEYGKAANVRGDARLPRSDSSCSLSAPIVSIQTRARK